MTPACTETSRAETGSSRTTSLGLTASARAMPMRWRWPPENWLGNRFTWSGCRPTSFISSMIRFRMAWLVQAGVLQRFGEDLVHGEPRVQGAGGVLEHHLQFAAHGALGLGVGGLLVADAADHHLAVLVLVELHDFQQGGGFAGAGLAHDGEAFALADVEAQAVHCLDRADPPLQQRALGQREVLADVLELEDGGAFLPRNGVEAGDRNRRGGEDCRARPRPRRGQPT